VDKEPPVLSGCPDPAAGPIVVECLSLVPEPPKVSASDTCSPLTLDYNQTSSGPPCDQIITRIWTARDACGNSASCQQIIVVHDTTPPSLTAGNIGSCYKTQPEAEAAAIAATTAADNCGGEVKLSATTDGTCNAVIKVTGMDQCGNSTSVTYNTRIDSEPPVFTACPKDVDLGCDPDAAQIPVCDPLIEVADNCGQPRVDCSFVDTGDDCHHLRTITYVATDACGNQSTCVQLVTWRTDNQPPVFTVCPPDQDLGCNPANIPACDPTQAKAEDNCGDPRITCESFDGQNGCDRFRTNVYTATDICGNTITCQQLLHWVEAAPPVFAFCPPDLNLGCNPTAEIPGCDPNIVARGSCGDAHVECFTSENTDPCNHLRTILYVATDRCGQKTECVQHITWRTDTEPPHFTLCPADQDLGCNPTSIPECDPTQAKAEDNCGDPTITCKSFDDQNGCVHFRTIVFTAVDECGNKATCQQVLRWVIDTTPPVVHCPGSVSFAADLGKCSKANVNYGAATADDDCDPNPAVACDPPNGSTFPVGNNTVICLGKDACGNVGRCSFSVVILDTQPPSITCPQDMTVECSSPNGTAVAFTPVAMDNCPNPTVFCSPPSGSLFPPGPTVVHCAAFDASDNAGVCHFTVTVVDTTPPVITCPADINASCNHTDGALVNYVVGVKDNCDGNPTLSCTPASGSVFPEGTTTVNCTASDSSGHSVSCSFKVTVSEPTVSLSIEQKNGILIISWPVTCRNYVLERTDDLSPPVTWTFSSTPTVENGRYVHNTVAIRPMRFYRLHEE